MKKYDLPPAATERDYSAASFFSKAETWALLSCLNAESFDGLIFRIEARLDYEQVAYDSAARVALLLIANVGRPNLLSNVVFKKLFPDLSQTSETEKKIIRQLIKEQFAKRFKSYASCRNEAGQSATKIKIRAGVKPQSKNNWDVICVTVFRESHRDYDFSEYYTMPKVPIYYYTVPKAPIYNPEETYRARLNALANSFVANRVPADKWPSIPDPEPTIDEPEQTTNEQKEPTMIYEVKEFVNGIEASKLTDDELIDAIREAEREIGSLETIETKSEAIAKRIADLRAQLKNVVEVLDNRNTVA